MSADPCEVVGRVLARLRIDIDRHQPRDCRGAIAETMGRVGLHGLTVAAAEFGGHAARNWLMASDYLTVASRSTSLGPRQAAILATRYLSAGELLPMLCAAEAQGWRVDWPEGPGPVEVRADIEVV